MTITETPSQPDASLHRWIDIFLKSFAGTVLVALAALWYYDDAADRYKVADVHNKAAVNALAHAVVEGGADRDSYPNLPVLPSSTPVSAERAEAAVAADAAVVSYHLDRATEATNDGRLLVSGAGATALVGFGLLYPLVSTVARGGAHRVRDWWRRRRSR
ncbi:hypothetical protein [Quadrisphaera sp. DSM 44207]|uniref:hypothetical protein n=1 Tax=Quadrisphaera sp. DSM 44207 TaxID=1881057 RepID=UPI00115FC04A|nr:hypothetical protein [Quadrisphaera sp. DSM 44207]